MTTDAYTPPQVASRVQDVGVAKARLSVTTMFVLAVLAGAFISLGAIFFIVVVSEPFAGIGLTRLVGGVAFSLWLILVIVAGAELFTGNNLVAMAWASRLISTGDMARNWLVVYIGNAVGSLGTVALVLLGGIAELGGGAVEDRAIAIAQSKASVGVIEGLALGILCNALVCLAVWLTLAGHTVTDKIVAIIFPITAFVAIGAEHSIANMFFLPYGIFLADDGGLVAGAFTNLAAVTVGNIVGGTLLVAGIYWLAYLRDPNH